MSDDHFICHACGRATPDSDEGCPVDALCEGCTPAAGTCHECRDLAAEDDADLWTRAAGDALREMHR